MVDISAFFERLTGSANRTTASSKKWTLRRTMGLAVGIGDDTSNPYQHWSLGPGGHTPAYERPCMLDDEYTFEVVDLSGTITIRFVVDTKNTFYLDHGGGGPPNHGGHQASITPGCVTEPMSMNDATNAFWKVTRMGDTGDAGAYHNSNPGSSAGQDNDGDVYEYHNKFGDVNKGGYTFTLEADQLTLNGRGSYIGLQSKSNAGDQGYLVPLMRTFTVSQLAEFSRSGGVTGDEMTLQMFYPGGVWTFHLEHYDNDSHIPDIPEPPCMGTNEAPGLPVDFEASYPGIGNFPDGTSRGECNENPSKSGANTSNQVGKLMETAGGSNIAGTYFDLASKIDMSSNCGMKVDVYAPKDTKVTLKLEQTDGDGGNPSLSDELAQIVSTSNTWETLTYDFSSEVESARGNNYFQRITFYIGDLGSGAAQDTTIYVDNIRVDASNSKSCSGS